MNHENHSRSNDTGYKISDFIPLIIIFSLITLTTVMHQVQSGFNTYEAMRVFMASFFIIFGSFKLINLGKFAEAYSMYDLVAKKFFAYGYIYPFLELGLGAAYFYKWNPFITNLCTLILMSVSALGVFNELRKGHKIMCACLGAVFKIPMTHVTLFEDLLMAAMALYMLIG